MYSLSPSLIYDMYNFFTKLFLWFVIIFFSVGFVITLCSKVCHEIAVRRAKKLMNDLNCLDYQKKHDEYAQAKTVLKATNNRLLVQSIRLLSVLALYRLVFVYLV